VNARLVAWLGSPNQRAGEALVAELLRAGLGKSFDEQALPELDSEALDFRVASEYFAPVCTLKNTDLETRRLLVLHQSRLLPPIGGVLLFGREPDVRRTQLPDAWIQAGRFSGFDKIHIAGCAQRGAPTRLAIFDGRMATENPGLPAPELEEIGTRFRVTLRTTRGLTPQLKGIDQTILDALEARVGLTINDRQRMLVPPRNPRTRGCRGSDL
jgi:hypothetical protein